MTVSTHVLDNARGVPAPGVPVRLDIQGAGVWRVVARGMTDAGGRLDGFVAQDAWRPGRYRLVFEVAAYLGPGAFFPEVCVVFDLADASEHLHIPLLLSPYGYIAYRGS